MRDGDRRVGPKLDDGQSRVELQPATALIELMNNSSGPRTAFLGT